jgi:hypothetical protein
MPPNFANISCAPLLLGVGSRSRSTTMAWRSGDEPAAIDFYPAIWSALTTATAFGSLCRHSIPERPVWANCWRLLCTCSGGYFSPRSWVTRDNGIREQHCRPAD